jgi:hypothetical protein
MLNPTKKYLLVYYGSGTPLPSEQVQKNREAWQTWNAALHETYGIHVTNGGKVVAADKRVSAYEGNLKGVSIIDADSLEDAVEKAKNSPSVQFGGHVEVFAEF